MGRSPTPQLPQSSGTLNPSGINALNLEPALPKLDDTQRIDWVNFKASQRGPKKLVSNTKPQNLEAVKEDFSSCLDQIKKREKRREEIKQAQALAAQSTQDIKEEAGREKASTEEASRKPRTSPNPNADTGNCLPQATTAGQQTAKASSAASVRPPITENRNKDTVAALKKQDSFSFNANASEFTPDMQQSQPFATPTPSKLDRPQFEMLTSKGSKDLPTIDDILKSFNDAIKKSGEKCEQMTMEWPEATGLDTYKKILGVFTPGSGNTLPSAPAMNLYGQPPPQPNQYSFGSQQDIVPGQQPTSQPMSMNQMGGYANYGMENQQMVYPGHADAVSSSDNNIGNQQGNIGPMSGGSMGMPNMMNTIQERDMMMQYGGAAGGQDMPNQGMGGIHQTGSVQQSHNMNSANRGSGGSSMMMSNYQQGHQQQFMPQQQMSMQPGMQQPGIGGVSSYGNAARPQMSNQQMQVNQGMNQGMSNQGMNQSMMMSNQGLYHRAGAQ